MAYRLLESLAKRKLESPTGARLLEGAVARFSVTPDPYASTATPKTQSFLGATAVIKTYNPLAATTQLRGTQA